MRLYLASIIALSTMCHAQLKELPSIQVPFPVNSMILAENPNMPGIFFVASSHRGSNENVLHVVSSSGEEKFSFAYSGVHTNPVPIQAGSKVFFLGEKLFSLDLGNFKIDSLPLKNQLCNGLTLQVSEKQTYLLADYVTETTIYEFETLHPVVTIKREDSKGRNWVKLLDGIILYQENSSTLEAMDLRSQTVLWQYQLPEREVKFAGIRLGKLRDGFTDFELVHEAGELRVVAAATGGILVKLEARSGNAILLRKEFKGDANNAGLIPHFTLVDMNGDGLLDVVGGSVDGNIYCISGKDFSVLWEFDSGEECQMPCAFADINKDGIPDVFQANDRKRLVILNGKSGSLLFDHQLVENSRRGRQTLLWLAVLNEKGTIDILAEGEQSVLKILEIQETREKPFQILWNENQ